MTENTDWSKLIHQKLASTGISREELSEIVSIVIAPGFTISDYVQMALDFDEIGWRWDDRLVRKGAITPLSTSDFSSLHPGDEVILREGCALGVYKTLVDTVGIVGKNFFITNRGIRVEISAFTAKQVAKTGIRYPIPEHT